MKKVIIIDATGSLAHYVIESVNSLKDIELNLFARKNKALLSNYDIPENNIIQVDSMNYDNLKNAIQGKDIL